MMPDPKSELEARIDQRADFAQERDEQAREERERRWAELDRRDEEGPRG